MLMSLENLTSHLPSAEEKEEKEITAAGEYESDISVDSMYRGDRAEILHEQDE